MFNDSPQSWGIMCLTYFLVQFSCNNDKWGVIS